MRSLVTGDAARNLDATGHFRLNGPPAGDPKQIDRARAETLAAIYVQQWGAWFESSWAKERGGPVERAALRVCGSSRYAASAFKPFPAELTAHPQTAPQARNFGPWWVVFLCGGSRTPQISVAVSALSTAIKIEQGQIVLPRFAGTSFVSRGVPMETAPDELEAAERAVQRIAQLTGRRVSEVPEFLSPLFSEGSPNDARLRLVLEMPVRARRSDKTTVESNEFFWGSRADRLGQGFEIAAQTQPSEMEFEYPSATDRPENGTLPMVTGRAQRRPDAPIYFAPVTMDGGN